MWTYRCYVKRDCPNLWEKWYVENPTLQGAHDRVFYVLEQRNPWTGPNYKRLEDRKGLCEVKFQANNVQWRIFGFFSGNSKEFVVLGVGNHKGKVYKPKSILDTCSKRMKEVQDDPKLATTCERPQ